MKCQSLFSLKIKKYINLSFAEFSENVVKVKGERNVNCE